MAGRRICRFASFFVVLIAGVRAVVAAPLDEQGDITLSVRAYTAARIATQDTDMQLLQHGDRITRRSLSFPISDAGHLRQSRSFVEAEVEHDLNRLVKEGFGPFVLLHSLPFSFRKLSYTLTYRGEYEGVFDYGPSEYRT